MKAFSLWEMIKIIVNLILSSPVFLITFITGTILLITMIMSIKKNHKLSKPLIIIIYIFLITFIIIYYNSYIYNILDNLINQIFTQIFFPNLATYVIILLATIMMLFYSIVKKNISKGLKIINLIISFIILFLFIMTINLIVTNKINIYEPLTVYSNKTLLVLIEFTTLTFVAWVTLLLSIKIVKKLIKKSDEKVTQDFLKNKNENQTNNESDEIEILKF
ncbi:MAG: hypothetical protein IKE75_03820 [Bacilli bacterium]|nr:hypothetical protein [Bacilli bacterium]